MLIECKIRRKAGSSSIMDDIEYRFVPRPELGGAHVCEVDHPAHIDRFLAIAAYRPFYEADIQPAPPEALQVAEEPPQEGGGEGVVVPGPARDHKPIRDETVARRTSRPQTVGASRLARNPNPAQARRTRRTKQTEAK